MGEEKSTYFLEMRRQRGGLRTANTDGGGQKHTLSRDEETNGGLRTQMGEKSTHSLEMRRHAPSPPTIYG